MRYHVVPIKKITN